MTPRHEHYLYNAVFLGQSGRDDLYIIFGLRRIGHVVAISQNGFTNLKINESLKRAYQAFFEVEYDTTI